METKHSSLFSENPLKNTSFPFLSLEIINQNCIPARLGYNAMHWHEDIQFIYVLDGSIRIQFPSDEYLVKKNQGFFINKSLLHKISEEEKCHYRSFIFPESLISPENHKLRLEFVIAYTENPLLEGALILDDQRSFYYLKKLNSLIYNKEESDSHKYEIITALYELWNSFIQEPKIEKKLLTSHDRKRTERLGICLSYIHENYSQDIALLDISNSANVSIVECSRIFESTIKTTPYEYLINYRIKMSIELLKNSSYQISEIATMVGYNSSSHFGKFFKKKMNLSPNQYRKAIH